MKKMLLAMLLVCCMALTLCLGGCAPDNSGLSNTSASTPIDPGPGSAPLHFCFGGNTYIYSGHYVYTLPEGFEFVREVDNDSLSLGDPAVDFSGNAAGYIYMSESDKTLAYFKPEGQNEYLRMEMRNIYFYFDGKMYCQTGMSIYTLPEGFTLAGEADPEGEPAANFAGNAAGEIYMSESDKTVAYFKLENRNVYGNVYWDVYWTMGIRND